MLDNIKDGLIAVMAHGNTADLDVASTLFTALCQRKLLVI